MNQPLWRKVVGFLGLMALSVLPVTAQADGNPENWCRNGHFPSYPDLRLARVKGNPAARVYFFSDDEKCPMEGKCQLKSYVIAGDELIAAKSYGRFTCAWYQPKKGGETVGWVLTEKLTFDPLDQNPPLRAWLGAWKFYDNSLTIHPLKGQPRFLHVTGEAYWRGLGDNIHTGEVDANGKPKGNLFESVATGEYDCAFSLRLIGRYLLVKDNLQCGGANVTFSGVYVR